MENQHTNNTKLINYTHSLQKKLAGQDTLKRTTERMLLVFEDMGYRMIDPVGESFDETRTDCEASIAGEKSTNLIITDTIKPIIYFNNSMIQKGVVIATSKS